MDDEQKKTKAKKEIPVAKWIPDLKSDSADWMGYPNPTYDGQPSDADDDKLGR